ncbi:hypothetical protein U9M48_035839 [Paspalum notatum var. saurae]|uniref:Integrase catalytic domain-containing protein n=1 Tax=Paspalum notatum var. saurae TaxID=547442 RepID=A0AAQ3X871_PASNO
MLQPLAIPSWKWEDIHMDFIVDRGSLFVSRFWEHLQTALGTTLIRSSAYHPQTSGQVERVNQILEDMLRASEFAYNNSYQKSLEMASFEALYGRRCRTPLNWSEPGERVIFGPDLVTQADEQVKFIHSNLKRAQSRQKSYSDKRRRPLANVYLRVSPMKGVHRFGVKGKLAPRYVGPFKITEQCGPVAYRLELPPHLAAVHDVFHVSQLKKCLRVPEEAVDTSQIQIEPDLTYEERPIKILDQKQRATRRRAINFYKMVRTKQTTRKAVGGRGRPLLPVTHTPPLVEDGLLHTGCREDCSLSRILCRALRQMGRRPCPFYSVQTMHRQGSCWARVVLPHPNSANPHTIVVYGVNEEEAYLKAVTTAITFLSPEEDAGHSDLRYLPT